MKVLAFPADDIGCGSYRMSWPAQYLKHMGMDVTLCNFRENMFEVRMDTDGNLDEVLIPRDTDVVVVQRISRRIHAEALLWLRKVGIAVVHDMDDDLSRIHGRSGAFQNYDNPEEHSWKWCDLACQNATLVTTSTARLAEVYGHGHGHVIDNYVPGSYTEIEHIDSPLLGWGGSTNAHPDDLPVVGRSVRKLVDEGNQFLVVGGESNVEADLHLNPLPKVYRWGERPVNPRYTGRLELMDWARGLSMLGVGIAPLQDSLFNAAKSRLKVLEMSAVGVPWVASPRPEYARFHKEANTGILGCSPNEWYRELKRLIENPSLRAEMGERGREYARTQTIEENAWRWQEAWELALKLQRS